MKQHSLFVDFTVVKMGGAVNIVKGNIVNGNIVNGNIVNGNILFILTSWWGHRKR